MTGPACYACRTRPAAGFSAYCAGCQLRDERPVRAREHGCPACGQVFGTLTLFDLHQAVDHDRRPVVSCMAPDRLGMVRDARGTWQTPAGVLARARRAAVMAGRARDARSAA